MPPDDIRNISAIAKKLRRSVVIEEPVEFAIRAAHTVKISAGAYTTVYHRIPPYTTILPYSCTATCLSLATAEVGADVMFWRCGEALW